MVTIGRPITVYGRRWLVHPKGQIPINWKKEYLRHKGPSILGERWPVGQESDQVARWVQTFSRQSNFFCTYCLVALSLRTRFIFCAMWGPLIDHAYGLWLIFSCLKGYLEANTSMIEGSILGLRLIVSLHVGHNQYRRYKKVLKNSFLNK